MRAIAGVARIGISEGCRVIHNESIDSLLARVSNANNFVSIDDFGVAAKELRERLEAGERPSDIEQGFALATMMDESFDKRVSRIC